MLLFCTPGYRKATLGCNGLNEKPENIQRHIQNPVKHLRWDYFRKWLSLREKCSYSEFSDPNAEKYGPEKPRIQTHFTQSLSEMFDKALNKVLICILTLA